MRAEYPKFLVSEFLEVNIVAIKQLLFQVKTLTCLVAVRLLFHFLVENHLAKRSTTSLWFRLRARHWWIVFDTCLHSAPKISFKEIVGKSRESTIFKSQLAENGNKAF